jgi:YidC/Oxa1 family membrane protein insertase
VFNTLLVHPIFNLLAVIYAILPVHDFGLSIIILTVIIRLILWPVVTKQLHSQRAMQELQPELARIKVEAKGDRTLEGQMTMELYKEKEINPLSSLLPLIIQLPIFIALYAVLRDVVKPNEIAHIAYPAVRHLGPIADIIGSKNGFHPMLLGLIDLAKPSPIIGVLAGLAQFIQTKQLAPKHATSDTQAQMTTAMTYIFPAITFFLGLTWASALALYWTTSSAVAILQQTIVLRRDVTEMEAVADEAIVVSEPKPTTNMSSKAKFRTKPRSGKA